MKGTRVAMIVATFPVRSETFIVSKAVGLIEAGWDVHIVCQRRDGVLLKALPAETRQRLDGRVHAVWPHRPRLMVLGLAPIALLWCLVRRPAVALRHLSRARSLRRFYLDARLIALAPTIVHFEFGTLAVDRMHLGAALGAKTIVSFRGFDLNYVGLDDPDYYGGVWRRSTAIHTLGDDLWQRAQRRGCPRDKMHAVISPAIDLRLFEPGLRDRDERVGTRGRPLRIVSVGRLEWKKGYEYALQALRILVDREIHCEYRIIGSGEFYTATAYARYQLGLTDCVTLLGARSQAEVAAELRWADVMLHSAVSEGFGNAVIEAQAMMLPVVCSSADGLSENVANGETGMVVPAREPAAIARALELLAGEPVLRERMGRAGRLRVTTRFQLMDQIEAFSALYRRVSGPGQSESSAVLH